MNHYAKTLAFLASALLLVSPFVASAAVLGTHASTTNATAIQNRITNGKSRADQEIKRRIDALNALATRVSAMKHVSDADKSSLTASIQSQIATLTALQAKIDADTDIATLKADIQSITKSYRIFLLILPKARITAAGDRIADVAATLTTLAGKLQARISATTGDTSALTASLSDMNAKITDATAQASASITEVAPLVPDNGDTGVTASNAAALKDARSKIEAAIKDLVTARQDAGSIVKGLKALGAGSTTASSTTP
jgi:hypothetical protein